MCGERVEGRNEMENVDVLRKLASEVGQVAYGERYTKQLWNIGF